MYSNSCMILNPVCGSLTSSRFNSLSFITPTPYHFLSLPLAFSIIIHNNLLSQ
jgi:type IV secretory pathway TraG/TraD family ATPase VirD4